MAKHSVHHNRATKDLQAALVAARVGNLDEARGFVHAAKLILGAWENEIDAQNVERSRQARAQLAPPWERDRP